MLTIATADEWPPAVSDGLALPCFDCGEMPFVDYRVDDNEWYRVAPTEPARRSVVCIGCFVKRGGDVTKVEEVQVIGDGVTALFHPGRAYRWREPASR